jgi:hypothetical protein
MGVGKTYRHVHQTQPEKQTTKTNTIQTTHMKIKTSILTLLAAALSAGSSWGQLPISPTSGIIRTSLTAAATYSVAVPFAKSIPFEGTIVSAVGTTLTLSGVTLPTSPQLPNHAIYIATHTNPSSSAGAYGRVVRITSNTATTVTTDVAIAPFAGDEFQIIEQHTLSSLLGELGTLKVGGGSTTTAADIVSIETAGVFANYWHSTGNGWRLTSDTGAGPSQANVPIYFGKGILIRKKGITTRNIDITGEALTGRFRPTTVASAASNLVNNPFTVAVPLIESGIRSFVTAGSSVSGSDAVFIETAGIFNGYWPKNDGFWYALSDTAGSTPITSSVVLSPGKAILFRDRGTAGFGFPQPFNE